MVQAYLVTIAVIYNGVAESRQLWMRTFDIVESVRQQVETEASNNKYILTSYTYVLQEAPDCVFLPDGSF